MIRWILTLMMVLALTQGAEAKIVTKTVDYTHGETILEGYLAFDDAQSGKRPGVVVVHEWNGLGRYVQGRAEQLAKEGYVAFCADIYGKGVRPATTEESAKQAGIYRGDRALMRARAQAALDRLKTESLVDPAKIAAIGYCFGGGAALELARSGADLAGVVSFHGNLDTPHPEDAKQIRGKVLICHGADDPYVSAEQVAAFQKEMREAGVDWQMNSYGGAVHSFTNPDAGSDPSSGAAYDAAAAARSWTAMQAFFEEIFK